MVFADRRKRTFIARELGLPVRQVSKIKNCTNLAEALINHATTRHA